MSTIKWLCKWQNFKASFQTYLGMLGLKDVVQPQGGLAYIDMYHSHVSNIFMDIYIHMYINIRR